MVYILYYKKTNAIKQTMKRDTRLIIIEMSVDKQNITFKYPIYNTHPLPPIYQNIFMAITI